MTSLDNKYYSVKNGEIVDSTDKDADSIPALDERWCENIDFVRFLRYNKDKDSSFSTTNEKSEYKERIALMCKDFSYLLRMPHDKFWCQIIYDNSLQISVNSYLQYAPRDNIDPELHTLHRLVFMICIRMATHKETKNDFFTPSVFGDLLYNRYVFDMPRLYDFARLYYANNATLVSKAVDNVFRRQPAYLNDLAASVIQIIDYLESCRKRIAGRNCSATLDKSEIDVVFDAMDEVAEICQNLVTWFKCFPQVNAFTTENFVSALSELYTEIDAVHQVMIGEARTSLLNHGLDIMRCRTAAHEPLKLLAASFSSLLNCACVQPLLNNIDGLPIEIITECADKYIELLTSVLCHSKFIRHCEILKPFNEVIDIFKQLNYNIDPARLLPIESAIVESCAFEIEDQPSDLQAGIGGGGGGGKRPSTTSTASTSRIPYTAPSTSQPFRDQFTNYSTAHDQPTMDKEIDPSTKTEAEIQSLISCVKDIIPTLGGGFIVKCLENFDFNLELVINALLTDNLPAELCIIDKNMKRFSDEKPHRLLDERKNIFDHDEFDVFHGSRLDATKVHQGKRHKNIEFRDQATIDRLKPMYDRYGNTSLEAGASIYDKDDDGGGGGVNNAGLVDMYDDDYDSDEMYEGGTSSRADRLAAMTGEEFLRVEDEDDEEQEDQCREKPGKKDQGLSSKRIALMKNSEEQNEPKRDTRQDFCMDPAVIREKREAAWRSKHPQKSYDVKGAEKGQGQSKDTLRNRAYKEKNKGGNRKAQADWKRRGP